MWSVADAHAHMSLLFASGERERKRWRLALDANRDLCIMLISEMTALGVLKRSQSGAARSDGPGAFLSPSDGQCMPIARCGTTKQLEEDPDARGKILLACHQIGSFPLVSLTTNLNRVPSKRIHCINFVSYEASAIACTAGRSGRRRQSDQCVCVYKRQLQRSPKRKRSRRKLPCHSQVVSCSSL